jgi:hypothetical protein
MDKMEPLFFSVLWRDGMEPLFPDLGRDGMEPLCTVIGRDWMEPLFLGTLMDYC